MQSGCLRRLSEALQTAEEKKKGERQGRKEKMYTQLNAEFQRIARKDKKAFINEQCEELFKKIGDIKGTFHQG